MNFMTLKIVLGRNNIRLKNEGPVGFSYRACIHPTD